MNVWDLRAFQAPMKTLPGHQGEVQQVQWCPAVGAKFAEIAASSSCAVSWNLARFRDVSGISMEPAMPLSPRFPGLVLPGWRGHPLEPGSAAGPGGWRGRPGRGWGHASSQGHHDYHHFFVVVSARSCATSILPCASQAPEVCFVHSGHRQGVQDFHWNSMEDLLMCSVARPLSGLRRQGVTSLG